MPFVLDASVAVSWCFEDEQDSRSEIVLRRLLVDRAVVPAMWPLELANAILAGERRQRQLRGTVARLAELFGELAITIEESSTIRTLGPILSVAREHQLAAHDAAYLELAMREGIPLATFDTRMADAAQRAGVELVATT